MPFFPRIPAYLVRCLHQISTAIVAEAFIGEDLTLLQWAVIVHLDSEPNVDQGRLAERAGIDRTSTGQVLDQLEVKGLVVRQVDRDDRRARLLHLTSRGEQLRRRLRPIALASQDRFLAPLTSDERDVLFHLLGRIIVANRAYLRPGAGRRMPRSSRSASTDQ